MTWLDDLVIWASTERERQVAEGTLVTYSRSIKLFAQWYEATHGRTFSPRLVTVADADAWLRSVSATGRKPGTVNHYLASIKLMGEWAACTGLTPTNCFGDLAPWPGRGPSTPWLGPAELVALFRGVRLYPHFDEQRKAMVDLVLRLMAEAGLRIEEVSNLRLDDLDSKPDRLIIQIRATRDERNVRVPESLRDSLDVWLSLRSDRNSPWVFGVRRGERMGPRSISFLVRTVADWAGLHGVTSQTLRVTYHHLMSQKRRSDPNYLAVVLGL